MLWHKISDLSTVQCLASIPSCNEYKSNIAVCKTCCISSSSLHPSPTKNKQTHELIRTKKFKDYKKQSLNKSSEWSLLSSLYRNILNVSFTKRVIKNNTWKKINRIQCPCTGKKKPGIYLRPNEKFSQM